jgi:hypothetical protein
MVRAQAAAPSMALVATTLPGGPALAAALRLIGAEPGPLPAAQARGPRERALIGPPVWTLDTLDFAPRSGAWNAARLRGAELRMLAARAAACAYPPRPAGWQAFTPGSGDDLGLHAYPGVIARGAWTTSDLPRRRMPSLAAGPSAPRAAFGIQDIPAVELRWLGSDLAAETLRPAPHRSLAVSAARQDARTTTGTVLPPPEIGLEGEPAAPPAYRTAKLPAAMPAGAFHYLDEVPDFEDDATWTPAPGFEAGATLSAAPPRQASAFAAGRGILEIADRAAAAPDAGDGKPRPAGGAHAGAWRRMECVLDSSARRLDLFDFEGYDLSKSQVRGLKDVLKSASSIFRTLTLLVSVMLAWGAR